MSEAGLEKAVETLENLKEIDLSECRLIGNGGARKLSGYKFVSVKANGCEGLSQRAILGLVSTSYNLNYLEVCGLREVDYPQLVEEVRAAYDDNKLNFSKGESMQSGCSW